MALREYAGAAKRTALVGDITAASTTFTVADATGYPTGATAPFVIALDTGLAGEEKVLITSRSGNTFTVSQRGFDGTSASAHTSGAALDHVLTATDLREANAHVNDSGGDPHPQYLTPAEASAAYVLKDDAASRNAITNIAGATNVNGVVGSASTSGTTFNGKNVRVMAVGAATLTDTAAGAIADVNVEISIDGGATWNAGPILPVQTNSGLARQTATAAHVRDGAATGTIQARLKTTRRVGTQLDLDGGHVALMVVTP